MAAGSAILASSVRVAPVRTGAERDAFISLPWRIYANDPAWVPPLRREVAHFLDPARHPFYRHGAAHTFLAYRGSEVTGRILVSDDPHFNERHGTNAGAFGLFEAINDSRVATALLEAASGWLQARGRARMLGPIEYSTNYTCGLLVDGFDTPPRLLMNHNPSYYAGLLEGYGLRPAKELYAWWIDQVPDLRGWQRRAARVSGRGISIRNIRKRDLASEIERAKLVYNEAWFNNWGFVRMTDAEFDHLGRHLAEVADERLLFIAERDDEPVGFSLALPDVNEAFRAVPDGRLTHLGLPDGLARLYLAARHIRAFRFFTLGVRPAYQGRGIAEALILRTLDAALAAGYTGAEMGWTLDDNTRVNRVIERSGARRYKTYRIYEGPI